MWNVWRRSRKRGWGQSRGNCHAALYSVPMSLPHDPLPLVAADPWLAPHEPALRRRMGRFHAELDALGAKVGLAGHASDWHLRFGLQRGARDGVGGQWCREWLPGAQAVHLAGDFNGWNRASHPLIQRIGGVWELFIPDGQAQVRHGEKYKLHIVSEAGAHDRVPATCRRVEQEAGGIAFNPVHWEPAAPYAWRHEAPGAARSWRIYEAHVGMAPQAGKVGSFAEFRRDTLPRIKRAGYDTVQLMAVQEHPYYASFGYQVSPFFAVSSRFGTPEDLKALVDDAHGLGLRVIMDLVHSHAAPNVAEGLAQLDGTDHQYFHAGERGHHPAWGSRCFDYGKAQVRGFLLSNVRYWLEEFRFDGFRFDGVTSMLYHDHGLGKDFTTYDDYFSANTDDDALLYLQLATTLAQAVRPGALQLAEDMSGLPGLARPVEEGGVGFTARLAMGIPDYWMGLMKKAAAGLRDEDWPLGEMWHALTNRRHGEPHVGYVESHDQALVGDKTLLMRLVDRSIYAGMSALTPDLVVDRGVALHKLIRLATFATCGGGWLNFMGNEFGHPEWVDFPREGNGWSFAHCRRQWNLADDPLLRYHGLGAFDRALMGLEPAFGLLADPLMDPLLIDEERKLLVFRRGPLVVALNFHPTRAYDGLALPVPDRNDYRTVLASDETKYSGHGRTAEGVVFPWLNEACAGQGQSVKVYLPNRCALVLAPFTPESPSPNR